MGYDERRFEVRGAVSRHNAPKDEEHDRLWAELEQRLRWVVESPRYREIRAEVV